VADLIRAARERKGWSLDDLAREAMLEKSTVYRIEKGKSMPRGETRRKLADALNISIEELGDTGETEAMDDRLFSSGSGTDLLRTLRHAWPSLTPEQQWDLLQAALDARRLNREGKPGKTNAS
jgi:transcriptional regulator with XRE-family HTH domain